MRDPAQKKEEEEEEETMVNWQINYQAKNPKKKLSPEKRSTFLLSSAIVLLNGQIGHRLREEHGVWRLLLNEDHVEVVPLTIVITTENLTTADGS